MYRLTVTFTGAVLAASALATATPAAAAPLPLPLPLLHTVIGGNNGDFSTMYSPNDPLFFIHHGFIDLL